MNISEDFSWNIVENAVWDEVTDSISLDMNRIVWIFVEDIVWNTLYDCTNKVGVTIYDYEY